jgi:phosphoglycolate phosphatase
MQESSFYLFLTPGKNRADKGTHLQEMQTRKYTHIIWDWNGTLLNDAWLCVEVMNRMLTERELAPLSLEKYRTIFDFPVRDYYNKLGFDFNAEPFESVGMEFMIMYNLRQSECMLFRDAPVILEILRKEGYRQYILSAREENDLRLETEKLGVSVFFDNIVGLKDHFAHGKSDIGRMLLKEINVAPDKIVFIGDTHHDAEVAAELGIDCILIPNGHHSEERILDCGVPVAYSLMELLDHLCQPQIR